VLPLKVLVVERLIVHPLIIRKNAAEPHYIRMDGCRLLILQVL